MTTGKNLGSASTSNLSLMTLPTHPSPPPQEAVLKTEDFIICHKEEVEKY